MLDFLRRTIGIGYEDSLLASNQTRARKRKRQEEEKFTQVEIQRRVLEQSWFDQLQRAVLQNMATAPIEQDTGKKAALYDVTAEPDLYVQELAQTIERIIKGEEAFSDNHAINHPLEHLHNLYKNSKNKPQFILRAQSHVLQAHLDYFESSTEVPEFVLPRQIALCNSLARTNLSLAETASSHVHRNFWAGKGGEHHHKRARLSSISLRSEMNTEAQTTAYHHDEVSTAHDLIQKTENCKRSIEILKQTFKEAESSKETAKICETLAKKYQELAALYEKQLEFVENPGLFHSNQTPEEKARLTAAEYLAEAKALTQYTLQQEARKTSPLTPQECFLKAVKENYDNVRKKWNLDGLYHALFELYKAAYEDASFEGTGPERYQDMLIKISQSCTNLQLLALREAFIDKEIEAVVQAGMWGVQEFTPNPREQEELAFQDTVKKQIGYGKLAFLFKEPAEIFSSELRDRIPEHMNDFEAINYMDFDYSLGSKYTETTKPFDKYFQELYDFQQREERDLLASQNTKAAQPA